MKEKRGANPRPIIGDIVEVTWRDHFLFEGNTPARTPVIAKSWGRLALECKEGVALTQTEVQEHEPQYPVPNIHTGQFIVRGGMIELKRIGLQTS